MSYQSVLDAASALYKAMSDYEADLLARPDADATRRAQSFTVTRLHIMKILDSVAQIDRVEYPVKATKPERETWPTPARKLTGRKS